MFEKRCKSCNVKIRHKPIIERVIKGTLGSITGFFSGALIGTLAEVLFLVHWAEQVPDYPLQINHLTIVVFVARDAIRKSRIVHVILRCILITTRIMKIISSKVDHKRLNPLADFGPSLEVRTKSS